MYPALVIFWGILPLVTWWHFSFMPFSFDIPLKHPNHDQAIIEILDLHLQDKCYPVLRLQYDSLTVQLKYPVCQSKKKLYFGKASY